MQANVLLKPTKETKPDNLRHCQRCGWKFMDFASGIQFLRNDRLDTLRIEERVRCIRESLPAH